MAITEVGPNLWALDNPNDFGRDLVILALAHNIVGFQVGYGVWWRLDSNYNGQRDVLEAHAISFAHVLNMDGGNVAPIQGPVDFGRVMDVIVDPRQTRMTGPTFMDAPLRPSRLYMDQQHWEDIVAWQAQPGEVSKTPPKDLPPPIATIEPRTCWDRLDDDL